jgi:hypothetical protein
MLPWFNDHFYTQEEAEQIFLEIWFALTPYISDSDYERLRDRMLEGIHQEMENINSDPDYEPKMDDLYTSEFIRSVIADRNTRNAIRASVIQDPELLWEDPFRIMSNLPNYGFTGPQLTPQTVELLERNSNVSLVPSASEVNRAVSERRWILLGQQANIDPRLIQMIISPETGIVTVDNAGTHYPEGMYGEVNRGFYNRYNITTFQIAVIKAGVTKVFDPENTWTGVGEELYQDPRIPEGERRVREEIVHHELMHLIFFLEFIPNYEPNRDISVLKDHDGDLINDPEKLKVHEYSYEAMEAIFAYLEDPDPNYTEFNAHLNYVLYEDTGDLANTYGYAGLLNIGEDRFTRDQLDLDRFIEDPIYRRIIWFAMTELYAEIGRFSGCNSEDYVPPQLQRYFDFMGYDFPR